MAYRFKPAKETMTEALMEMLKYDTIGSYFFVGTDLDISRLRSRALGIADNGRCIITTSKFRIGNTIGITLRYGGKIYTKKRRGEKDGIQNNT